MAEWLGRHGWEALAVLLGLAYLLLIIRQKVWGWPAAIASAAIYAVILFEAALYMQSALQGFYVVTAAYGWWHWRGRQGARVLPVIRWPRSRHLVALAVIALLAAPTAWWLAAHTDAAFPWLDALTAWGAVVTTWMVACKVLENWYYWLVIDTVALGLYAAQGLWLTVGLFAVYLVLAVVGLRQWQASMVRSHA